MIQLRLLKLNMNNKISRIATKYTETDCVRSKLAEREMERGRGDLKSMHLRKSKKATKQYMF